MKRKVSKAGFTMVEVLVSVFLVGVAAAIIYSEMLLSYRTLMRSRAKLEAQSLAFDRLWDTYNTHDDNDLPSISTNMVWATPQESVFGTTGAIVLSVLPDTEAPLDPTLVQYWDLVVSVWPADGSTLQIGTDPLARYAVRRYRGER